MSQSQLAAWMNKFGSDGPVLATISDNMLALKTCPDCNGDGKKREMTPRIVCGKPSPLGDGVCGHEPGHARLHALKTKYGLIEWTDDGLVVSSNAVAASNRRCHGQSFAGAFCELALGHSGACRLPNEVDDQAVGPNAQLSPEEARRRQGKRPQSQSRLEALIANGCTHSSSGATEREPLSPAEAANEFRKKSADVTTDIDVKLVRVCGNRLGKFVCQESYESEHRHRRILPPRPNVNLLVGNDVASITALTKTASHLWSRMTAGNGRLRWDRMDFGTITALGLFFSVGTWESDVFGLHFSANKNDVRAACVHAFAAYGQSLIREDDDHG